MSTSTTAPLIQGLEKMLKNRGSMTVKEVQLLEEVIAHLKEHDNLEGEKKMANGVLALKILSKFFFDPECSRSLTHLLSHLIDKLL